MTPTAKVILAITGLITTCTVFALASRARKIEQANLLKNGARATGTVIFIGRESDSAGMPMVLRYQFIPEGQSNVVHGQCITSIFGPYKPGDAAIVCYNKALPSSSIILSPKGTPL